jgi:hypothetical protein
LSSEIQSSSRSGKSTSCDLSSPSTNRVIDRLLAFAGDYISSETKRRVFTQSGPEAVHNVMRKLSKANQTEIESYRSFQM